MIYSFLLVYYQDTFYLLTRTLGFTPCQLSFFYIHWLTVVNAFLHAPHHTALAHSSDTPTARATPTRACPPSSTLCFLSCFSSSSSPLLSGSPPHFSQFRTCCHPSPGPPGSVATGRELQQPPPGDILIPGYVLQLIDFILLLFLLLLLWQFLPFAFFWQSRFVVNTIVNKGSHPFFSFFRGGRRGKGWEFEEQYRQPSLLPIPTKNTKKKKTKNTSFARTVFILVRIKVTLQVFPVFAAPLCYYVLANPSHFGIKSVQIIT